MNKRENLLRAVRFDNPEYIPIIFHINKSCWQHYPPDALKELMASHPFLFPDFDNSSGRVELDYDILEEPNKPFTDGWGCVWETTMEGIVGTVTYHPLANWDNFANFSAPNPEHDSGKGPVNWQQVAENLNKARQNDDVAIGGLRHGHTFQTLTDIRGYENLLFDMVDNEPRLWKLIEIVENFNMALVQRYLELGVEWMCYPEDLGMQNGPMISPDMFRKYIKPSYQRLMKPAREKGVIIHMHSDGHIHALADDLIDGGVDILNLQDLVNGIDWIRDNLKGKVCIDLDIDRQSITANGTPEQIDELIRKEVSKLGSPAGGLMMIYGLYPNVPLKNVKALMDALEHYAFYFRD